MVKVVVEFVVWDVFVKNEKFLLVKMIGVKKDLIVVGVSIGV